MDWPFLVIYLSLRCSINSLSPVLPSNCDQVVIANCLQKYSLFLERLNPPGNEKPVSMEKGEKCAIPISNRSPFLFIVSVVAMFIKHSECK